MPAFTVALRSTIFLTICALSFAIPTKFVEVANVNKLSFAERSWLFEPTSHVSSEHKTSHHNIHIFDKFGTFMRLNYHSQYADHIDVLELKPNGENGIESVQCLQDDSNTLYVRFGSTKTAQRTADTINQHLDNDDDDEHEAKYFVSGHHEWKCYNSKERKYTPILRAISSATVDSDDKQRMVLTTSYASYADLFETLEMLLDTNINSKNSASAPSDPASSSQPGIVRRRALWDYYIISLLWKDIVHGVQQMWNAVASVVLNMDGIIDSIEHLNKTQLWDAVSTGEYSKSVDDVGVSWHYNYDGNASVSPLQFERSVSCSDCYTYANLTYSIAITIENYQLTYYKLVAEGEVMLNIDMTANASYETEWSIPATQTSAPDLGFAFFGVHFGFSIYGEFAVGTEVEVPFKYSIWAKASIKRGIEYDARKDTTTQNYIRHQSFEYDSVGPILNFQSTNVTLYGRTTLGLSLSMVGEVYIGVQPKFHVGLTDEANYGVAGGCAIDYTPSMSITVFVHAKADFAPSWNKSATQTWRKQPNVGTYTLPAGSSGCITHSEISSLQSMASPIANSMLSTQTAGDDVDEDNTPSWWPFGDLYANSQKSKTTFLVNYTKPETAYKNEVKWGKTNNLWYANLTTLNDTCFGNEDAATRVPGWANLIVYPSDNDGEVLHAIYNTINVLSSDDGFAYNTNMSCSGRYKLSKIDGVYASNNDQIVRYQVSLVDNDYKCDVHETLLTAAMTKRTQLPLQMDAIILDSSFETIMMHGTPENCFIFALIKNTKLDQFVFDGEYLQGFEQGRYEWTTKTLFGAFHCDGYDMSHSYTLFVNAIDWRTGNVNATLLIGVNGDDTAVAVGRLNFEDFTLDFSVYDAQGNFMFNTNGFITVFINGKLLYTGVIPDESTACTGFIFQGQLNVDQFQAVAASEDHKIIIDVEEVGKRAGYAGIGFAVALLLMALVALIMFKCCGYRVVRKDAQQVYKLMQEQNYVN